MAIFKQTEWTEQVPGSPDDCIDGVQSHSTRIWIVKNTRTGTSSKRQAVMDILGWAETRAAGGLGGPLYIHREMPAQHPDFPHLYARAVVKIKLLGTKKDSQGLIYVDWIPPAVVGESSTSIPPLFNDPQAYRVTSAPYYALWVSYHAPLWDVRQDAEITQITPGGAFPDESALERYIVKLPKPGSERFQAPGGWLQYVDSRARPQTVPFGIPKLLPKADVSLKWMWVPSDAVPFRLVNPGLQSSAIEDCLGKVNSTTLGGFEPGTLLFVGGELEPDWMANSKRAWHITYRFVWQPSQVTGIGSHNCILFRTPTGLSQVVLTNPGSGYAFAPTISFSGGSGSGAAATAIMDGVGGVASVILTNAGSGYTSAPAVIFTGPNVAPAQALAVLGTTLEWSEVSTDGVTHALPTPSNGLHLYDDAEFRTLFRPGV